MRPRKFYVVFELGRAIAVVEGLTAAKLAGPAYKSFTTQIAAEEFAMWWNHDHQPWWLS